MTHFAFDEALAYVRSYRNGTGDPGPFDVNGVIHLMLAALDNLRDHLIEGDWDQIAASANEEQKAMLIRLGSFLERHSRAGPSP